MASALQEISPLRTAAEEFIQRGQGSDIVDADFLGAPSSSSFGAISITTAFTDAGAGAISHTLGGTDGDVSPALEGVLINLTRTADTASENPGQWACTITNRPATYKSSYTPQACTAPGANNS
nr:pilin [Halomonas sp. PGE1]